MNHEPDEMTDIAIIGAGPYGLSIAAHLASRDVSYRIFGLPMSSWSEHMPKGMQLKSEGFASSLSDPRGEYTLADYCKEVGQPYKDIGLPVRLETFVAYGQAFQKKFVPNLERKLVVSVTPAGKGFELILDNQEKVFAKKVVVATGITNFARSPEIVKDLPPEVVTHSWEHSDLEKFRGRRVGVLGAGASALDVATLLHESGAEVELIARSSTVRFHEPPSKKRSLRGKLRRPITPIGPGLDLLFYSQAPGIFRLLPQEKRLALMKSTLGPAPGWFVKQRIAGKIPFHLSTEITAAKCRDGKVELQMTKGANQVETIVFDHLIAATGYRVDLERLGFLNSGIRQTLRLTGGSPLLSSNFESSVPGLYFIGLAAANTFGPLLRFACGSSFAAGKLARHLARQVPKAAPRLAAQDAQSYGHN